CATQLFRLIPAERGRSHKNTAEAPSPTPLESILPRLPPEGQAWVNGLNRWQGQLQVVCYRSALYWVLHSKKDPASWDCHRQLTSKRKPCGAWSLRRSASNWSLKTQSRARSTTMKRSVRRRFVGFPSGTGPPSSDGWRFLWRLRGCLSASLLCQWRSIEPGLRRFPPPWSIEKQHDGLTRGDN